MHHINKSARRIMEILTICLKPGDAIRVDNAGSSAIMSLSVERLSVLPRSDPRSHMALLRRRNGAQRPGDLQAPRPRQQASREVTS